MMWDFHNMIWMIENEKRRTVREMMKVHTMRGEERNVLGMASHSLKMAGGAIAADGNGTFGSSCGSTT